MADTSERAEQAAGQILVVDDYPLNRMKLARILEDLGHAVATAEDGRQALAMMQAQPFDLVLLDILMPDMDGYEVLREIKGDARLRDIPVIVISAVDEIDSVARCIEMGAEDYLHKPFNPTLLRARLRTSMEKKKLRDLEQSYLRQEMMLRQSEKLATLGRLSAGMAHELNNPAAAARRGAEQLRFAFVRLQRLHWDLCQLEFTGEQLDVLKAQDEMAQQRARHPAVLDSLAQSDREAELEGWLDSQGIEECWEYAPALAAMGYDSTELSALAESFTGAQRPAVIEWLGHSCIAYSLLEDVGQGTRRIAGLVDSLKSYSFMDQAPVQAVELREGLESTLAILRGKVGAGVTFRREYAEDLPAIEAHGSELNQVWTNIIDNAIEAMGGQGEVVLRTRREGPWAVVEIEDSGPGIPEGIQPKVFDPFFTTKPPGQGTGLGLSISHHIVVNKHRGKIALFSRPGSTRVEVRLPIDSRRAA